MTGGFMRITGVTMATCLALGWAPTGAAVDVSISVDLAKDNRAISPLVYGSNSDYLGAVEGVAFRRQGGNRLTGYNWENNASHAGLDWQHSSDGYLGATSVPGKAITDFHDKSLASGSRSLITLPAAGYVSKDKNGTVSPAETAPSARWAKVVFEKGSAFTAVPDAGDANVHVDELVAFLSGKYGNSSADRGIRHYSVDNEPGLWPSTHPRIHPDTPSCAEIVQKNAALAAAVKKVDPQAEIFGGVFYGYGDFATFQNAKDWKAIEKAAADGNRPYTWFIDHFLEEMKKAADREGKRLLDVLDIHWYPEAIGDRRITEALATSDKDNQARVQAPRSLWDSTYAENSWIAQWATPKQPVTDWSNPTPGPVLLLPHLFSSIAKYYPGTRLAVTEFDYGGGTHVSGGLATADFLGIAGRLGVYATNFWPLEEAPSYVASAYRLYRNYDGKGSAFPGISAAATASDRANASVFAAFRSGGDALHIIVLNKNFTEPLNAAFILASPVPLTQAQVFGFDNSGAALSEKPAVAAITGNAFTYPVPPLSAYHFVIKASGPLPSSIRFPGLKPLAGRIPGFPKADYRLDGKRLPGSRAWGR